MTGRFSAGRLAFASVTSSCATCEISLICCRILLWIELTMTHENLVEGVDYYLDENGYFVFTVKYLLSRGHCCQNGCRHCPYGYQQISATRDSLPLQPGNSGGRLKS